MPTTSTIRAIAHALPATTLTYEDLAARFGEKHVASIFRMSGIRDRRVVARVSARRIWRRRRRGD